MRVFTKPPVLNSCMAPCRQIKGKNNGQLLETKKEREGPAPCGRWSVAKPSTPVFV